MKVKLQIVIFAFFLVGMASLFRYCSGPFYFGNNNDPSYFYLFNFLYILEGKSPQFVDHPGTTLDMLGALVVKIFFAPLPNTPWLQTYAPRAEQLLGVVWFLMVISYAASLMALGFYAFKKSQDRVFTGLILLSSLWLVMVRSFNGEKILPISANVNSDTMMMTAVNLMLLAVLCHYFSPKIREHSQAACLGAAVAFAMATKFTALPFFVVALCILETWPQRILMGTVAAGGFVLLTCPIWGSYPHMIFWVKGLVLARGMHGHGGEGFDAGRYFQALVGTIKSYWFFVAGWLLAGMVSVLVPKPQIGPKISRVLLAVALGGLVQVIIMAKQTSYQYMAPMIGLSSLGLAFLYKAFPDWWHRGLKYVVIAIGMVSLGMMAVDLWQVNEETNKTRAMLNTIANDYPQCRVCPFYRSSTPGFGFVFWDRVLGREDYSSILKTYYPDLVYYDIFGGDFKDSAQQIVPLALLKQQSPCVLIYGSDEDPKDFEPGLTVNKIYTNAGPEALYEVISQRSNRAQEFFQFAMVLYSQGRYEDALKAALASQQLGLGKDISALIGLLKQKVQTH